MRKTICYMIVAIMLGGVVIPTAGAKHLEEYCVGVQTPIINDNVCFWGPGWHDSDLPFIKITTEGGLIRHVEFGSGGPALA